ncbi:MAG TPA: nitroreductase family protein, partial [Candidatus Saccharimonadales bacterium]|nr:nitroreductase family protein [Candidatus Saccharimonadales bacterium]
MRPRVPLDYERPGPAEAEARALAFLESMRRRRSVRDFSPDPVPEALLRSVIEAAAQAPSGANRQPWRFVLVTDPAVRKAIREAA